MTTPSELRVMIAREFMEQFHDSIIVESSSGESLNNIWRRIYWLTADRTITMRRTNRQFRRMTNLGSSDLFQVNHVFFREVPVLFRVSRNLREEGRKEFLEVARAGLAHAEAQNTLDRDICKIAARRYRLIATSNNDETLRGGPIIHTDEMALEEWKHMQSQGIEMVCNALRWFVLRHVCELLGLRP
jgi:hypothetical protein